jgi:hypothetical protein
MFIVLVVEALELIDCIDTGSSLKSSMKFTHVVEEIPYVYVIRVFMTMFTKEHR